MKFCQRVIQIVTLFGLAFTGIACGGGGGGTEEPPPPPVNGKTFSVQLVEIDLVDTRNRDAIDVELLPVSGNEITLE